MEHPLLTALFDLFLIGSALCVIAALVAEHVRSREPSVGAVGRVSRGGSAWGTSRRPASRQNLRAASFRRAA